MLPAALGAGCRGAAAPGEPDNAVGTLKPTRETAQVAHDPDDPAIWVSSDDPSKSLILGTDKEEARGALYVFALDGSVRQIIGPLDRPNNVDVEYGFNHNGALTDIAVVTERMQRRLRVFGIPRGGGPLVDLAPSGLPVLEGEPGEAGAPMGIALYRRPADNAIFAIVSPKAGASSGYLWQYRIESAGGGVAARFVRRFGTFSGIGAAPGEAGEIEAVVVDDDLGFVYYADERYGIRKWHADPDAAGADQEIASFGRDGYGGDREGLALYTCPGGRGYLLSSDQIEGGTRLVVYRREGDGGDPHRHTALAVIPTTADNTDGLDVTSRALPDFPLGLLVMMNSGPRTFQQYSWEQMKAFTCR